MRLNGLTLGLTTLAVLAALQLAGCGKKRPPLPPIDKAAAVGEWLEIDMSKSTNPRIQAGEPLKFFRHLVLNEDGTFEFSLKKKSGKPYAKQKITGTWDVDVEKNKIIFTVTDNQFKAKDERHGWAPASSMGVRSGTLSVIDVSGEGRGYERVR